jgi:hypothetical protein
LHQRASADPYIMIAEIKSSVARLYNVLNLFWHAPAGAIRYISQNDFFTIAHLLVALAVMATAGYAFNLSPRKLFH